MLSIIKNKFMPVPAPLSRNFWREGNSLQVLRDRETDSDLDWNAVTENDEK